MKKEIAIALAIALTVSLAGCGGGENPGVSSSAGTTSTESKAESKAQAKPDEESKAESKASNGALGNFEVTIPGVRLGKDYDGKPIAYIKFHFTNNSDKAASFSDEIVVEAYQNGTQVEMAMPGNDSKYDPDNYMKKVKKGISLDLEYPVSLSSTKGNLEVNAKLILGSDDEKVTKTFNISKLK